jgi:hypothetical protein
MYGPANIKSINEIYSEFQIGKNLFDKFAIQNGLK